MTDTNLDVRQHTRCELSHRLEYESLTWNCHGQQTSITIPRIPLRSKNGQSTDVNIPVIYDTLNKEDDFNLKSVTMNISLGYGMMTVFMLRRKPFVNTNG